MRSESQTLSRVWPLISCPLLVSHSNFWLIVVLLIYPCCIASSCDVERGFSRGGLTVSKLRHGLSDESTRASTVLHAWSKIPGLIPESEIIQVFKDKCRRLKGGKETDKDVTVVDSDDGDISED